MAHDRDHASRLSRLPLAVLLSFPLAPFAQAANTLPGTDQATLSTLLVLMVGLGMIVVAAAVIALAIRELRREARERREMYRGRGSPHAPRR